MAISCMVVTNTLGVWYIYIDWDVDKIASFSGQYHVQDAAGDFSWKSLRCQPPYWNNMLPRKNIEPDHKRKSSYHVFFFLSMSYRSLGLYFWWVKGISCLDYAKSFKLHFNTVCKNCRTFWPVKFQIYRTSVKFTGDPRQSDAFRELCT